MVLLTSCVRDDDDGRNPVGVGMTLPQFSVEVESSDGSVHTVSTQSLAGTPGAIVFFNTGCPDCQRELPQIQKYYDESGPTGFNIICISREESRESILDYWQEHGLTLPFAAREDRYPYSLFAESGIPRTYVYSASLIVTALSLPAINP